MADWPAVTPSDPGYRDQTDFVLIDDEALEKTANMRLTRVGLLISIAVPMGT
jgi:hypothetical protein